MPSHSETVQTLADKLGIPVGSHVDLKLEILGVSDLRSAQPQHISFLANPHYEELARTSRAGVILVDEKAPEYPFPHLRVANPSKVFGKIAALFAPPSVTFPAGVHPTAVVAPDVILGEGVSIQAHVILEPGVTIGPGSTIWANCYIGAETKIGENALIYPNVVIRERAIIGNRVIIHPGAVIGADGFGYEFSKGKHVKIPQTGFVQIDDDVEIGANTTIDRGRFSRTHIGEGTKIDNLVQIAHNCTIGANSIIVAQTGLSGSTNVGKYVTIAGQVGTVAHINIGDRATVTGQAGVTRDVPAGAVVSGKPPIPLRESLRLDVLFRRLPEFFKRLQALEKHLFGDRAE